MLANQIMNRTRERFGAAPSNFGGHLEAGDSERAQQLAKDPYVFDFLGLSAGVAERDLEQALMDRMVDTLPELGTGFSFVGRPVHFDVADDDFYLDLLFFSDPPGPLRGRRAEDRQVRARLRRSARVLRPAGHRPAVCAGRCPHMSPVGVDRTLSTICTSGARPGGLAP